jgi:hypothetical protein
MPLDKRYRYQPSAVPTGITVALLDWLRREFQALSRALDQVIEEKVAVGYGNMGTYVDQAIANISATWQTITQYGVDPVTGGGVVLDPVAGTFVVSRSGAYTLAIGVSVTHNESGSDREMELRLYNVTDAVPMLAGGSFFTSKNTAGTSLGLSLIFSGAVAGKKYAVQIGSAADTYTTCAITGKRLSISGVGA